MVWPLALLSIACTPGIAVEGDDLLREAALSAIRRAGVVLESDGCAALTVKVDRTDDDRIAVQIADSSGRRIEREVGSAEMIAALVEAWTTVPSELMDPPEPEPTMEAHPLEPIEIVSTELPPARAPSRFLFSLGAEVGVGDDGSIVAGPAAAACVRLGMFCIDLIGRFLYGGHSELELALGSRIEIELGPLVIAPGISTGVAWLHLFPERGDAPLACSPIDPCLLGADGFAPPSDRARPRAHAGLTLVVPFTEILALETIAGATWSPLAKDLEPRWSARAAVGLRIGI